MILLSFVLLGRRDWHTRIGFAFLAPGLLFLLTGAIGLICLVARETMLGLIQTPMVAGLITLFIVIRLAPSRLLERL